MAAMTTMTAVIANGMVRIGSRGDSGESKVAQVRKAGGPLEIGGFRGAVQARDQGWTKEKGGLEGPPLVFVGSLPVFSHGPGYPHPSRAMTRSFSAACLQLEFLANRSLEKAGGLECADTTRPT